MIRTLGAGVDLPGLIADAAQEGRQVHLVDAAGSREATLAAFARVLDLPSWFGHNLDALEECLEDLLEASPFPWELILDHALDLCSSDPDAYDGIHLLLRDLARRHPGSNVTVILR